MYPATQQGSSTLLPCLGQLLETVRKTVRNAPDEAKFQLDAKCAMVLLAASKDMENSLHAEAAINRVAQLEDQVKQLQVRPACHLSHPTPPLTPLLLPLRRISSLLISMQPP